MKIGLFFGSFNPIHIGHLIIGQVMTTSTDLDQVWYVVSPQNPFKKNTSLLHEFDRLLMVERAIADNAKLKACDIEFSLSKPSYTIDTLTAIAERCPEHEFVLIIGEDNLVQFKNWKNYQQILDYYSLYIYARPNTSPHDFTDHSKVKFIEAPKLNISATYIRQRLSKGLDVRYMVPEPVEALIKLKKFYQ